jgi:nitroreductase
MITYKQLYQKIPEPIRRIRHEFRRWLAGWCYLLSNGFYDTQRFAKHSLSVRGKLNQDNKRAKLIFLYHKIEKAMALPEPRPGFGRKWIPVDFIPLLIDYSDNYGCDELVQTCCVNLESYVRFNNSLGVKMDDIYDLIKSTLDHIQPPNSKTGGGIMAVNASSIHSAASIDFRNFVINRHSIRNFTSDEVDHETIEAAIRIAQRTPSVCNRQAWHVYAFHRKESILHALKYQNGNDGFNSKIQLLLMVTGDLSAMMASFERHQIWVDGGMFSMSLVYALHSQELGTCCLNLCHNAKGDRMLRKALKIAPSHTPVMMIAVGHIPTTLHVAHSLRRRVEEVVIWE